VAVGVAERARDLRRDRECFLEAELLFASELRPERFPAHQRQDVPDEAIVRAGVDEGEDVRVIEPRANADLLEEALSAEHRGEVGPEDLERYLTSCFTSRAR